MKRSQLFTRQQLENSMLTGDRGAGKLREENDALPEFVGRTTRTVRGMTTSLPLAMISASCRMALAPCRELDPLTTWKSKRSTRFAKIAPSRLALMRAAPLRSGR